jgi:hypothetical protein
MTLEKLAGSVPKIVGRENGLGSPHRTICLARLLRLQEGGVST